MGSDLAHLPKSRSVNRQALRQELILQCDQNPLNVKQQLRFENSIRGLSELNTIIHLHISPALVFKSRLILNGKFKYLCPFVYTMWIILWWLENTDLNIIKIVHVKDSTYDILYAVVI